MIMSRRVLVIDQATKNIGYNIIEIKDNKIKWIECKVAKIKGDVTIGRICDVMKLIMDIHKEFNLTDIVFEDVPLERKTNVKTMIVLLKLLGCLEATAWRLGLKSYIMNVNHWKALAGIKSRTRDLQKSESMQLALKRWVQYADVILSNGDDVADSLNMGYSWLIENNFIKK